MSKFLSLIVIFLSLFTFGISETNQTNENTRASTGGAQTLEDILARQKGKNVDYEFRKNALGVIDETSSTTIPLGTLGLNSDAEIFRQLRYNEANINVSSKTAASEILVQDSGMNWLIMREGPLQNYGGLALLGMVALLSFFSSRFSTILDPYCGMKAYKLKVLTRKNFSDYNSIGTSLAFEYFEKNLKCSYIRNRRLLMRPRINRRPWSCWCRTLLMRTRSTI